MEGHSRDSFQHRVDDGDGSYKAPREQPSTTGFKTTGQMNISQQEKLTTAQFVSSRPLLACFLPMQKEQSSCSRWGADLS